MKFTVENRSHTEPRYVDERLQHLVSFAALEQLSKNIQGLRWNRVFMIMKMSQWAAVASVSTSFDQV